MTYNIKRLEVLEQNKESNLGITASKYSRAKIHKPCKRVCKTKKQSVHSLYMRVGFQTPAKITYEMNLT